MTVLDREMYTEAEAARLLGMPAATLHYWLEGGLRRKVEYRPVIRPEATGRNAVTWAEFVEAGWLREYRQQQIPMRELRHFIGRLRGEFGVPYPLAHEQPLVTGKSLVQRVQQETDLAGEYCLVGEANGQLILTPVGANFVHRVVFDDGVAAKWRPHQDERSTVTIDPTIRFGRPAVAGISTAALWDEAQAGASEQEIAERFGISATDVRWALAYESTRAA